MRPIVNSLISTRKKQEDTVLKRKWNQKCYTCGSPMLASADNYGISFRCPNEHKHAAARAKGYAYAAAYMSPILASAMDAALYDSEHYPFVTDESEMFGAGLNINPDENKNKRAICPTCKMEFTPINVLGVEHLVCGCGAEGY